MDETHFIGRSFLDLERDVWGDVKHHQSIIAGVDAFDMPSSEDDYMVKVVFEELRENIKRKSSIELQRARSFLEAVQNTKNKYNIKSSLSVQIADEAIDEIERITSKYEKSSFKEYRKMAEDLSPWHLLSGE